MCCKLVQITDKVISGIRELTRPRLAVLGSLTPYFQHIYFFEQTNVDFRVQRVCSGLSQSAGDSFPGIEISVLGQVIMHDQES